MNYYIYDIETYPNIFTFCGKFINQNEVQLFEISDRKNQAQELYNFLGYLKNNNTEMIGFNNVGFDYPVIHEFLINPHTFTYEKASTIADRIIKSQGKFGRVPYFERIIPQIDIFKINHFDNNAKATSLKALQFAMRSHSVEDLPFDIRALNDQEKDELCRYNVHDVTETETFVKKCLHMIDMRRDYLNEGILKGDVLNYSDVKIGTEYLITRLGKDKCYSGSKPKQSFRDVIEFKHIILQKNTYRTQPYNDVLEWYLKQRYVVVGGERPKYETHLAGLSFHFGVGGVHASADSKVFRTDEEYQIIDIDVAAMYPSVAIANNFAPEHLAGTFNVAYKQIKLDRAKYPKGSPRNAALKLAGNGAYGNSNNPYSPLYDPQFMLLITINGQLQILQLVEMMDLLPHCELIQANTDGITVRIRKDMIPQFKMWCKEWEKQTGLELEEAYYNRMFIRDVNNYIAETMEGKLKRKGAYEYCIKESDYDGKWHKNHSNYASRKAAELTMLHNIPVECAIKMVTDPFDFMLRYKTPRSSHLYIGDTKQLKTVRYFVSHNGQPMKKVSPPKGESGQYKRKNKLTDEFFNKVMEEIGKDVWDSRIHTANKSKYETRITSVESGRNVTQCNVATDFDWNSLDWNYYIDEAKKLIIEG